MALATVEHHSYGPTANDALRGQRTVTRAGEGEVREEHKALRGLTRLHPGMRPALLVEVQPLGRVGRHFAEHLAELAPLVQILDAPVPQVVDNVMDAFKFLDQPMTEQVIEVPRISCPPCPSRSQVPVPLTAEQLVEVPTVLSYSLLLQRTAEQTIGIAVPGSGGGARGGLHGLSQGQGSTADCGADFRAPQRIVEQISSFLQFLTVVEEVLVEVVTASPRDRALQRFLLQNASLSGLRSITSIFPVEVFMVFKVFSLVQLHFPSRCLLPQFMRLLLLSGSSWRLLPQFTLRLFLLVMMLHASSRI